MVKVISNMESTSPTELVKIAGATRQWDFFKFKRKKHPHVINQRVQFNGIGIIIVKENSFILQ